MQTPGEEFVGEYLRQIRHCEFVQYNLQTTGEQGEIDVIGIDMSQRRLYVCEVAVHLVTGLQYVKNKRPDNVARFVTKFGKDIRYARAALPDYEHIFMLCSPILKNMPNAKNNQMADVREIHRQVRDEFDIDLQLVINEHFQKCIVELREYCRNQTQALTSPIARLLQIEERLTKFLTRENG